MIRISLALMLTALTTLMLELTLMRIFDVLWYSNMAYMVVTLAMFCFGLSGVYSTLRPLAAHANVRFNLTVLAFLFGVSILFIQPIMNALPFNFRLLYLEPAKGIFYFTLMYLALGLPFFLAGLIFTTVFSIFSEKIQSLYFWDLSGAALGCIILVPFLPQIGPGGLLFLASGFAFWAAALFVQNMRLAALAFVAGIIAVTIPYIHDGYFEFQYHIEKRGVKKAQAQGRLEHSYWDPVSKIDVTQHRWSKRKHIAYDGGTQSSWIYPFSGNIPKLRNILDKNLAPVSKFFTGENVIISNYLKRDTGQKVLIIGSAGGQEIKAALTYGAGEIDAVELVGYVTRLGKEIYSEYNGDIFNHPKVNAVVGEGRSYIRSSKKKYDIIQIFSNHTSSSIAAGTGAMATTYLQTDEAYKEYFRHLTPDGILHINHHVYPKMITTAALAWKQMGRTNFRDYVLVLQAQHGIQDNLPTVLIKMSPWTAEEVDAIKKHFVKGPVEMVEDPGRPDKSYLPDDFYSGSLPKELAASVPYWVQASTDDKPYFNFLRKTLRPLDPQEDKYTTFSTAGILNSQLKRSFFPKDVVHLFVTGLAALFFAVLFIFVPLVFSQAGREKWQGKPGILAYFSSLGAGFIIFELVFIQIFMKLIGYPLYTYSTVVFALLLSAGVGSMFSAKFNILPRGNWQVPFWGILVIGIVLLAVHQPVFNIFLQSTQIIRISVAVLMIFPLGFFLGMPFPLGILALAEKPKGAIAWAWAMNGLFTVIGGIGCVVVSLFYGFRITLCLAMLIYCLAFYLFSKIRHQA